MSPKVSLKVSLKIIAIWASKIKLWLLYRHKDKSGEMALKKPFCGLILGDGLFFMFAKKAFFARIAFMLNILYHNCSKADNKKAPPY